MHPDPPVHLVPVYTHDPIQIIKWYILSQRRIIIDKKIRGNFWVLWIHLWPRLCWWFDEYMLFPKPKCIQYKALFVCQKNALKEMKYYFIYATFYMKSQMFTWKSLILVKIFLN